MKLFGKTFSEYVQFQKVFLIATAVVGLTRLGLSLAGADNSLATYFSMTVVQLAGLIYYAIRVHTTGFGSYPQVLILISIQSFVANVIISAGIAITAVTGTLNIFSTPEFSGNANHWFHAATHLIGGPTLFSVILWVPAALVMLVTKFAVKTPPPAAA